MSTPARKYPPARSALKPACPFVFHPSFTAPDAEHAYGGEPPAADESLGFLPDEATRDCAKRMHYAGWRASQAGSRPEAARWQQSYYDCRDRIVLGNRKLTFRAVQRWNPGPQLADDMAGECQIVLIKAVEAFNPWLGIRFSTYAFTCLMRALSRLSQRHAADHLAHSLPLNLIPSGEPSATPEDAVWSRLAQLDEYFQEEHPLLTPREKTVLRRRFHFHDTVPGTETLEQVGRVLGLSKERVRQVQTTALEKLRAVLLEPGVLAPTE
jgi:RNA polymerase sigma factor (sigma-70 family)